MYLWLLQLCIALSSRFFFFQAEDGIRDLVRSRGLGDVYKRQPNNLPFTKRQLAEESGKKALISGDSSLKDIIYKLEDHTMLRAVSYTHLTLPTSDLV